MKATLLLLLLSTPVLADEVSPIQFAQALVDLSETISEIKMKCATGVRQVQSEMIKEGLYQHRLSLQRQSRGQLGKDCDVVIIQDYTPTYHDGAIEYGVAVHETK